MALSDWVKAPAPQKQKPDTPATPATLATLPAPKPRSAATAASAASPKAVPAKDLGDPTAAEISELTQRIRELAHCEQWTEAELAARLWEADHMAPINVRPALAALRRAVDAGLAIWPTHLTTRAHFTLCELVKAPVELAVIDGGRAKEPEAA